MLDITALEKTLGYHFRDPEILGKALAHGSASPGWQESVKCLAWLGDAVLAAIVSALVYDATRGEDKAALHAGREEVRRNDILGAAGERSLKGAIQVGDSLKTDDRPGSRPKMFATHLEAIVGAAYLDGGFEAARTVIGRVLEPELQRATRGRPHGIPPDADASKPR